MCFPRLGWTPRRKAELLILLFALFIVELRAYSAFCDYVRNTLYWALAGTATTLSPVEVVLENNTSASYYMLHITIAMRNPNRLTVELLGGFYEVALFDALELHDHQGFWLDNFTLPTTIMFPGYGFNTTYHFPANRTQVKMLKYWGYRVRILLWAAAHYKVHFTT